MLERSQQSIRRENRLLGTAKSRRSFKLAIESEVASGVDGEVAGLQGGGQTD